jgi:hypothetical protein
MSVLTGRYSGSAESEFDRDIGRIATEPFADVLSTVEQGELSDAFWSASLPQAMNTSASNSPVFNIYLASQVRSKDAGFLSSDITVNELVSHKGDIHHIFPRDYLKKHDHKRRQYNQIANYVIMQSEINIKIGNRSPSEYFDHLQAQCNSGRQRYGGIQDMDTLRGNLAANCIPESIFDMDVTHYQDFLTERRRLMALKIHDYYFSL